MYQVLPLTHTRVQHTGMPDDTQNANVYEVAMGYGGTPDGPGTRHDIIAMTEVADATGHCRYCS